VGFSFTGSGPTVPVLTEVRIVQQSWIKVRANEPRLFDDLWQMFVELTNLIVLAIGQPVRPLKLGATCDVVNSPDGKPYPVELIDNRRQAVVSSHEVASYDMLFTFADIQQRFQDIVKAWFGRDEKIRSLYDLYFGTLRSGSMYVEHRFLNMFQALESFDRRSFTHSPEKQKKHQERLTQILGCVAEVYKKWLKNKLEHSHEPSAADRIRRLVKDLGADWVLGESDITLAGDIRNYYTHFDSKLEQRLPPMAERVRAMYNLSIRLQLLCELLLLRAAGLMPDEMKRRMQETRRLERRLLK
jgi:hypothetical protein